MEAAKSFLEWATSEEYLTLVGEEKGWISAPPGTRISTYENEAYTEAAPFAEFVRTAMENAAPSNPTCEPVPYTGVQFVVIPGFQGIGTQVGQVIAAALSGQQAVEAALQSAQAETERTMSQAGYPK